MKPEAAHLLTLAARSLAEAELLFRETCALFEADADALIAAAESESQS